MALRTKVLTQKAFFIPKEFNESPTDPPMTWTVRQVPDGLERVLWDYMVSLGYSSTLSMYMLQAMLSFVSTTITIRNEDGEEVDILPKTTLRGNGELDRRFIDKFVDVWTNTIPVDLQDWILLHAVWRLNPHWRPNWVTDEFYESLDENGDEEEKKD